MKNRLKNRTRLFLLLLIPAVMWCWYSDSSNKHYHMMPDGSIVVHSHPYEADGDDGPVQSHEHSDAMLNLLFIVSGFAKIILPLVAAVLFFLVLLRKQEEIPDFQHFSYEYFFNHTHRGPPVVA